MKLWSSLKTQIKSSSSGSKKHRQDGSDAHGGAALRDAASGAADSEDGSVQRATPSGSGQPPATAAAASAGSAAAAAGAAAAGAFRSGQLTESGNAALRAASAPRGNGDAESGGDGLADGLPQVATDQLQQAEAYLKLKESMAAARPCSFEEARFQLASIGAQTGLDPAFLARIPELLPNLEPDEMERYLRLGVLPPETPAPLCMLERLWKLPGGDAVTRVVQHLEAAQVLRTAVLEDGSTWCLMSPNHMEIVLLLSAEQQPQYHNELLLSYCKDGSAPLRAIEDDGYILQNVAHHLICSNRLDDLAELLTDPVWVEAKLHAYGVAAIVQDFRRCLGRKEDAGLKLLLQAFMLSLGCCMEHPMASMLRQQMLSRLMAVSADSTASDWLREWYERQMALVAGEEVMAAGIKVVHLMPRSATLEQAGGLHRMTLRGHSGPVRRVVISPNGRDVITVSEDGTAQVWDMNVGDFVMQLARDKPLTDVAVAPDGQLAAVASLDGNCCIWDLDSGQVRHVLKGHAARVNAVVIDRQGLRCVTASDDGTVRVWALADGSCEQILEGHGGDQEGLVLDVAISADGCLAATVSDDATVCVWDLDDEVCMHVLEGHTGWVVSVEFIGSTSELVTASHDLTARVWDGVRGRCMHVLKGHAGRLNKVTVDASGTHAVTCSDDLTARVWDLDTGECLSVLKGHSAWISDAVLTRDGSRCVTVSGDAVAIMWDAKTGGMLNLLEGHSDAIRSVVLTYHGGFTVTASDDCTVRVWDTKAPPFKKVAKHAGRVTQLRPLPDGRHVLSAGDDGVAQVWDAGTCTAVRVLGGGGGGAALSYLMAARSGTVAVTGSADRRICVWDTCTGELTKELPPQHGSRVKHMAFDGSCSVAALLLFDSTVLLVDVPAGRTRELVSRKDVGVLSSGLNAVDVVPSGRLVLAWSKDGSTRVWDASSGALVRMVPGPVPTAPVLAVAVGPDEAILATGSGDRAVRLSRMADGAALAVLTQPGGAPMTEAGTSGSSAGALMEFSPDGQLLAVVLDGVTLAVWDLAAGVAQRPLVLPPPSSEVTGMAFAPVGQILATWGSDCTLRLWCCGEAAMGEQLAFFMVDAAVTSVCFVGGRVPRPGETSGGRPPEDCIADIVALGDAGGYVHFIDFPRELQMAAW